MIATLDSSSEAAHPPDLQVGLDLQKGHLAKSCGALHDMADDETVALGGALLEVADLESRERWAAARRRHHAYGSRAQPGYAHGTARALARAQGQTLICMDDECGALVHLQAARRQARAAGRSTFIVGDGCASKHCSGGCVQPGRFARRQAKMAKALLDGSRTLVLWPPTTYARVSLWAAPPLLAIAKAHEVTALAWP